MITNNNNNNNRGNNNHGNNNRGNYRNNNNGNYHYNNKRKIRSFDRPNKQQKRNEPISTKERPDEVINIVDSDEEEKGAICLSDSDEEYTTAPSSPVDSDDEFKSAPTSPIENDDSASRNDIVEGANAVKRKLVDIEEISNTEAGLKRVKATPKPYSPSKQQPSSSAPAPAPAPAPASASTTETSKPPSYLPTGDPSKEILVYPFSGKKAFIICNSDVQRLAPRRYLNDCIMNTYPMLLQDEIPRDDIHTFSTFFFTRLTEVDESSSTSNGGSSLLRKAVQRSNEPIRYENVRRWTNRIDIFDKKHLIVPIAQKYHWFLAVITNPGSCDGTKADNDNEILIPKGVEESVASGDCCITLLDSLSFNHDDCYEQLCDYLKEEAINRLNIEPSKFKKPKHIKGHAPQQENKTDCGVHCLQCIKRIYKEPEQIQDALLHPNTANDHLWNSDEIVDFRKNLALKLLGKADEYEAYLKERKKE